MLAERGPLDLLSPEAATIDHPVWREISEFFKPHEFEAPEKMDAQFLRLLFKARVMAKVPFRILDTIRADAASAHGEIPCAAVDLEVLNSYERSRVVRSCYAVGFTRIGVYPGTFGVFQGKVKRDGGGIHVDASRTKPKDRMWTHGIQRNT